MAKWDGRRRYTCIDRIETSTPGEHNAINKIHSTLIEPEEILTRPHRQDASHIMFGRYDRRFSLFLIRWSSQSNRIFSSIFFLLFFICIFFIDLDQTQSFGKRADWFFRSWNVVDKTHGEHWWAQCFVHDLIVGTNSTWCVPRGFMSAAMAAVRTFNEFLCVSVCVCKWLVRKQQQRWSLEGFKSNEK